MTSAVRALLTNDLRLQFRYRIHAAYGVVIALYCLGFVLSGPAMPDWLAALLIYSDPSVLGFFFLGGLMMLEKGEGVRAALAITPASANAYLLAKAISLTALALLATFAMGLAKSGPVDWPLLFAAVVLTSVFFVAIGAVVALWFKTVNAYLIGSAGLLLPITAPAAAAFLDPLPAALWFVPTIAQPRLVLVAMGYGQSTLLEIGLMLAVLGLSCVLAWLWAIHHLSEHLGRK